VKKEEFEEYDLLDCKIAQLERSAGVSEELTASILSVEE
jgi:hypothetical protein